jgi:DNA-binding MurR/RpiR family transcriptional regulator
MRGTPMNLFNKLHQSENLTSSEKAIIDVITHNPQDIIPTTTAAQLAEKAYSSASTVVRLCRKLGFSNFTEFKTYVISQYQLHEDALVFVDATIPFKKNDDSQKMLRQLTELESITINQLFSLMNYSTFNRVIDILANSDCIDVYGAGANVSLLYDFAYKMGSIHRLVRITPDHQQQMLNAVSNFKNHCAILVSYSGETIQTCRYASLLKEHTIKTISITSNSSNHLVELTDEHLYLASMEHTRYKNTKIGSFATNISIITLMNYLYAGVFKLNYDANYNILLNDRIVFSNSDRGISSPK